MPSADSPGQCVAGRLFQKIPSVHYLLFYHFAKVRENRSNICNDNSEECNCFTETHPFIEFDGIGILLIDIDILHIQVAESKLHEYLSQPLAEIVRMQGLRLPPADIGFRYLPQSENDGLHGPTLSG